MNIYTVQIAKWRKAKELSIPLLDTTVKSGVSAFSPSWDIVLGHKSRTLSEEAYRESYVGLLRESWVTQRGEWEKLLSMETVALGCYCKAGTFCHRHILKEAVIKLLEQRGLPYTDHGELG